MWFIESSQKGTGSFTITYSLSDSKHIMAVKDKDISIAVTAFQNAFGGMVDQVEYSPGPPLSFRSTTVNLTHRNQQFYARYVTESAKVESPIPRLEPMILITNRGKDIPHQLDFLDIPPREYSKKGSLEQLPSSSPRMEMSVSTKPESNPRRELVTRRRPDMEEKYTKERVTRRSTTSTFAPRRETRSQSALTKHIPYTPC
jgi:hypothetical protein